MITSKDQELLRQCTAWLAQWTGKSIAAPELAKFVASQLKEAERLARIDELKKVTSSATLHLRDRSYCDDEFYVIGLDEVSERLAQLQRKESE